jgi:hypothetical protein
MPWIKINPINIDPHLLINPRSSSKIFFNKISRFFKNTYKTFTRRTALHKYRAKVDSSYSDRTVFIQDWPRQNRLGD